MSDVQIHWFAIVNSVVIVLFLSGESPITCTLIFSTKLVKEGNMFLSLVFCDCAETLQLSREVEGNL